MATSIDSYYHILGVTEGAALADIKSAYRKKAILLHPDRNRSPSAHEDFILLTEAYEYLSNLKSGKINVSFGDWQTTEKENARQKAAEHAQMQHEEFINSDYYKTSEALATVGNYLLFLFVLIFMFGAPILGYLLMGIHGLWAGLFLFVGTSPGWLNVLYYERPKLGLVNLGGSLLYLSKNTGAMSVLLSIINILLFLKIDVITEVPFKLYPLIFIAPVGLAWLVPRLLQSELKFLFRPALIICVVPTIINLFFLLNFLFATGARAETYSFRHRTEWNRRTGRQETSLIYLDNNKYDDYIGFRVFYDYDAMKNADHITYTFEDGLFGFRVIKSFKFNSL